MQFNYNDHLFCERSSKISQSYLKPLQFNPSMHMHACMGYRTIERWYPWPFLKICTNLLRVCTNLLRDWTTLARLLHQPSLPFHKFGVSGQLFKVRLCCSLSRVNPVFRRLTNLASALDNSGSSSITTRPENGLVNCRWNCHRPIHTWAKCFIKFMVFGAPCNI